MLIQKIPSLPDSPQKLAPARLMVGGSLYFFFLLSLMSFFGCAHFQEWHEAEMKEARETELRDKEFWISRAKNSIGMLRPEAETLYGSPNSKIGYLDSSDETWWYNICFPPSNIIRIGLRFATSWSSGVCKEVLICPCEPVSSCKQIQMNIEAMKYHSLFPQASQYCSYTQRSSDNDYCIANRIWTLENR